MLHGLNIQKFSAKNSVRFTMFFKALLVVLWCSVWTVAAEPGPQALEKLVFTFAGDLMAHTPNFKMKGYERIYEGVREILLEDDLSFVNLEAPVDDSGPYQTFPQFNVKSEYVWPAIAAGFDVFSLANNHSWDRYSKGVQETLKAMQGLAVRSERELARKIVYSGLKTTEENKKALPLRLERFMYRGIRVGFVAIAEYINFPHNDGSVYFVDYNIATQQNAFLQWLNIESKNVDLCIVSVHGGVEYETKPRASMKTFAAGLADAGADIIWAHHPHVLQPWYTANNSAGGQYLVLPSMGNFISGQPYGAGPDSWKRDRSRTGDSALFRLTLEVDYSKSPLAITMKGFEPVMISHFTTSDGGVIVRTFGDLLVNTQAAWNTYYQKRFDYLKEFFPGAAKSGLLYPDFRLAKPLQRE